MIADATWKGANSLLDHYVGVQPGDEALIAYTADSREVAAIVSVALQRRGITTTRIRMGRIRDRGFRARIEAALPTAASMTGRLVVLTFERDTMSHTGELRAAVEQYEDGHCVVIRAISSSPDLLSQAVRVVPSELSALNTSILERCMSAQRLRIKADGGTDLTVRLDPERYHWISNRAIWRPGRFVILPAGEVATYPTNVEGRLVADYAFNMNAIVDRDSRLDRHPVTVILEGGRAVDHECGDQETYQFIGDCFAMENARRVGELGFGTNIGIDKPVPMNSHINERRPGIHLGFGQHNQPMSVVEYWCELHLDLVARGGRVWIDDDPVPLDLNALVPSSKPHPSKFYDEDVASPDMDGDLDGDCCGLLNSERENNSLSPVVTKTSLAAEEQPSDSGPARS